MTELVFGALAFRVKCSASDWGQFLRELVIGFVEFASCAGLIIRNFVLFSTLFLFEQRD